MSADVETGATLRLARPSSTPHTSCAESRGAAFLLVVLGRVRVARLPLTYRLVQVIHFPEGRTGEMRSRSSDSVSKQKRSRIVHAMFGQQALTL
jgi:hypothetical protein